ncbi:MAG: hypothetical protein LBS23_00765, partial [Holosporaceae bacterium]|nr:hypothetical protein [Holosporaceae bacterium]
MLVKQTVLSTRITKKNILLNEFKALDCFSIVKNDDALYFTRIPRLQKWISGENFVILGTGGSSLGGQCIHAISKNPKNIKFVNNLDPSTLNNLFSKIDLQKTNFLCISKSGETLETVCQTMLIVDLIKNFENFCEKFIIITENKKSSLRELANEFNFLCLDHPETIGGRFSVFSIVGMLPAMLCGIDPKEIIAGGSEILNNSQHYLRQIEDGVSFVLDSFSNGLKQHVSFIYSDKLAFFGAWLAQLYAESSGKSGNGITPITAVGSVDQHSQLQLYLDGAADKCFTFFLEKQISALQISDQFIPKNLAYIKNKRIHDIFGAQYKATISSMLEKNYNVREIEIPEITPKVLGAMFMHFMLEVACVCKMIG